MNGALYWIWGAGPKSPTATGEAERVLGLPSGSFADGWRHFRAGTTTTPPITDLAVDAVDRLRSRVRSAPYPSLFFGAPSLQRMSGGLITRARERRHMVRKVVFEDHGVVGGTPAETMLFFGRDAISLRTLPQHRRWFEQMRVVLAPDAEIFMIHCFAAADGGRLIRELSRAFDRPVYAADEEQIVGNQALEGNAFRAEAGRVSQVRSFPRAVLHFD